MQIIWLYGSPGVGKSTTAWRLYRDLTADGTPCAYVDIDQLGMCYPARTGDPDRHRLKADALAAVLPNYADAGAELLLVSGVLDPHLTPRMTTRWPGPPVVFCRLTLGVDQLRRRLDQRGGDGDDWALVLREERELDEAQRADPVVAMDGLRPRDAAEAVRAHIGADVTQAGRLTVGPPVRASSPRPASPAPGTVLWLCGPAGVGKSEVGWAVFTAWRAAGTTAYLDLQQLGFSGAQPSDRRHTLQAANVAALWGGFRAAGATCLVLSGPVHTGQQLEQYRAALPGTNLTVCRLRAHESELTRRIHERGAGAGPRLAGDPLVDQPPEGLARAAEESCREQQALDVWACGDIVMDTTGLSAVDVAEQLVHD